MTFSAFLAFLLVAAQGAAPGSALERFFVGRTEGAGTVRVIVAGGHGVRDRAVGRMERGALVIDQVVEEEGKPPRRRRWRLVRSGAKAITGTISDVRGPVAGTLDGNTLHLRYRLAEGPTVEQWITLQPGGRTASNRMIFRRLGLRIATVESVLRRVE